MKLIDLLNKIANGEETPKKFKFDSLIFNKNELGMYDDEDGDNLTKSIDWNYLNLNDEIEIIKENKNIEEYQKALDETMSKKMDLENIINEAIEYIKEYCIDDEFYINLTNKEKHIFDVLNILYKGR